MRLDLSADPWGVAILAAATVLGLGIVIGLLALVMRTSKRAAGWFCGLGSLAFLATAAGGTWERIEAHDAAAKKAAAEAAKPKGKVLEAPPVPEDGTAPPGAGSDSTATDDGGSGGSTSGAASGDESGESGGGETGEATPTDIADDAPPIDDEEEPTPPVAAVADFPQDKAAAKAEANERLREAKKIVDEDEDCRDPDKLQKTWLALSTIPPNVLRGKVKAMARKVEGCRRRLVGGRQWKIRKDQVAARDAFAKTLKKRLSEEGIGLWTSVYGADHEKINAGSKQLDQARIDKLLDDGLRDELTELGFEQASISDGKKITREDLSPKTVKEIVDEELAPYGLHEILVLGE